MNDNRVDHHHHGDSGGGSFAKGMLAGIGGGCGCIIGAVVGLIGLVVLVIVLGSSV